MSVKNISKVRSNVVDIESQASNKHYLIQGTPFFAEIVRKSLVYFGQEESNEIERVNAAIEYLLDHSGGIVEVAATEEHQHFEMEGVLGRDMVPNVRFICRGYRAPVKNEKRPVINTPWELGDRIENTDVDDDTCVGWICVEGGTPGVWKRYGYIKPFGDYVEAVNALPAPSLEQLGRHVRVTNQDGSEDTYVCVKLNANEYGWKGTSIDATTTGGVPSGHDTDIDWVEQFLPNGKIVTLRDKATPESALYPRTSINALYDPDGSHVTNIVRFREEINEEGETIIKLISTDDETPLNVITDATIVSVIQNGVEKHLPRLRIFHVTTEEYDAMVEAESVDPEALYFTDNTHDDCVLIYNKTNTTESIDLWDFTGIYAVYGDSSHIPGNPLTDKTKGLSVDVRSVGTHVFQTVRGADNNILTRYKAVGGSWSAWNTVSYSNHTHTSFNNITITGTTNSTSTTTGIFQVKGGVGVSKDLYAANIKATNSISATTISATTINATNITGDGSKITNINVTAASSGTLPIVRGGTGATTADAARTNLGAAPLSHSHSYLPLSGGTVTGATVFSNTTASTSTATGAVRISGGLGVAGSIYGNMVVGAVWNDYAEYRSSFEEIQKGRVVIESHSDSVKVSSKRLERGAMLTSDTYGFAIGETSTEHYVPVAVAGRVLAWTDKDRDRFKPGDAVCSGKNGTVSKMRWWEKILFPERIVGVVSNIPQYSVWGTGKVEVDNRIWIKVK